MNGTYSSDPTTFLIDFNCHFKFLSNPISDHRSGPEAYSSYTGQLLVQENLHFCKANKSLLRWWPKRSKCDIGGFM